MIVSQNEIEYLKDMVDRGEISAGEANVEFVLSARVKIVKSKIPKDVRVALDGAVKEGKLLHMKKEGLFPECYCHPGFDYLAIYERKKEAEKKINALSSVVVKQERNSGNG